VRACDFGAELARVPLPAILLILSILFILSEISNLKI